MKFIHLTDVHLTEPGARLWGLDPCARFDACLADITTHHPDAAFCVITGDLTERGEPGAYVALKDRLADFPIPTHLLLGNHDDRAAYFSVFPKAPRDPAGYAQGSMTRDGAHFLFLDTLKGPPSSAGRYCEDRQRWLAERLRQAQGAPVCIFMHHPPFAIGHPLMDLIKLDEAEEFAALLRGHDVRHIFFGHAHRTISGTWRGIAFAALPSLNHQLPLVGGSVPTVYSEEPPMYAAILLENDRIIVHADAFLNREPAQMASDAERGNWF